MSRPFAEAASPSVAHAAARSADVATRLDILPIKRLHVFAMAVCGLGFSFDLMEVSLGSALSAIFSLPPHAVTPEALAWLLASMYIGAVVGAPLMGWFADRCGRRTALIVVLAWLTVTSLLAAASADVKLLTIARGLSGIALGAYPPLMFAYLTDLLPPTRRGMLIFFTVAAAAIGPPAGIFLIRSMTPIQPMGLEGWRWAYLTGAAGAATAALMLRALPESPRWLAVVGRAAEAESELRTLERSITVGSAPAQQKNPPSANPPATTVGGHVVAAVDKRGERVKAFKLTLLYFLSPWSTAAFPLLMGAILINKGFKLSDTLLFVGASTFGPILGTLLSAAFIDRFERRTVLLGCAAGLLFSGSAFVVSALPMWLVMTSVLYTLIATLYLPTMTLYGAEVFPTGARASLSALAWAFNRLGAAIAPLVLLPLLRNTGPVSMSLVIAATLGASICLLLVSPRGRARRAVE